LHLPRLGGRSYQLALGRCHRCAGAGGCVPELVVGRARPSTMAGDTLQKWDQKAPAFKRGMNGPRFDKRVF